MSRTRAVRRHRIRGAALLLVLAGCGGSERTDGPRVVGLEAAHKAFATRLPDRADDARPLSAAELTALARPRRVVDGLLVERPVGTSVTDRPLLGWRAVPGKTRYHVLLVLSGAAPGSRPIVDETTSAASLAFPARAEALEVGRRYVLSVSGDDDLRSSGQSEFDVLPVPYRSRWKTLTGDLDSNERDAIRDLLIAHAALRRGLFDEAERRLASFEAARPAHGEAATLHRALDVLLGR